MKRYCVLENLRTENNYKWEDLQTDNFWDIYSNIKKILFSEINTRNI